MGLCIQGGRVVKPLLILCPFLLCFCVCWITLKSQKLLKICFIHNDIFSVWRWARTNTNKLQNSIFMWIFIRLFLYFLSHFTIFTLYYRIIVVRKCKWSDESKWLYFFLLINQKQSCFNAYLFVLKIVP